MRAECAGRHASVGLKSTVNSLFIIGITKRHLNGERVQDLDLLWQREHKNSKPISRHGPEE